MRSTAERTVRVATTSDAEAIARVHIDSWRETYAELLPATTIPGAADLPARRSSWRRVLDDFGARECTWVGLEQGRVVGFAHAGPARDDDADPRTVGELRAIYLLAWMWRRGLGRALNAAAERFLSGAGFTQATLWVLADNPRARRFYEAAGWRLDGAERSTCDDALARTLRYRRDLPEPR